MSRVLSSMPSLVAELVSFTMLPVSFPLYAVGLRPCPLAVDRFLAVAGLQRQSRHTQEVATSLIKYEKDLRDKNKKIKILQTDLQRAKEARRIADAERQALELSRQQAPQPPPTPSGPALPLRMLYLSALCCCAAVWLCLGRLQRSLERKVVLALFTPAAYLFLVEIRRPSASSVCLCFSINLFLCGFVSHAMLVARVMQPLEG